MLQILELPFKYAMLNVASYYQDGGECEVYMNTSNFQWLEENIDWLAQPQPALKARWNITEVLESNE